MEHFSKKIDRVELIDGSGRRFIKYHPREVKYDIQDKEKTLKIFVDHGLKACESGKTFGEHEMLSSGERFMLDSNQIEGEDRLNPGDGTAIILALDTLRQSRLDKYTTLEKILQLHKVLGENLKKGWVGRLRNIQVYVGNHVPPAPEHVERLMEEFCDDLPNMDSWEAHNKFQKIHPFQDLNGRVGRLIWLAKAIDEDYKFELSFLQKYYYQTLSHSHIKN